jgi:sterol desaturase/sphingolipid hydroxylase (fatty acid hydroxylase superfamily)
MHHADLDFDVTTGARFHPIEIVLSMVIKFGGVEAIVAGHQPPELTAKALTERIEIPHLWSEQERTVGIS